MKSQKFSHTALIFTFLLFLFLIIPIGVWFTGWEWRESQYYSSFDHFLFYLTETGSAPIYAGIMAFILSLTLCFLCKKSHWLMIFLTVFILHLSTQVIKTGLKLTYKEPRPYMSYLVKLGVNIETFYDENRTERSKLIKESLIKDNLTPKWLQVHWANETGYSFPSGHTIFAVCWVFIFVGFLRYEKTSFRIPALTLITCWALLMLVSRLRLGMHFPIDLLVSTIIAYLLNLLFFYAYDKKIYMLKRDL